MLDGAIIIARGAIPTSGDGPATPLAGPRARHEVHWIGPDAPRTTPGRPRSRRPAEHPPHEMAVARGRRDADPAGVLLLADPGASHRRARHLRIARAQHPRSSASTPPSCTSRPPSRPAPPAPSSSASGHSGSARAALVLMGLGLIFSWPGLGNPLRGDRLRDRDRISGLDPGELRYPRPLLPAPARAAHLLDQADRGAGGRHARRGSRARVHHRLRVGGGVHRLRGDVPRSRLPPSAPSARSSTSTAAPRTASRCGR